METNPKLFNLIRDFVKKVPKGKVTTYGFIAKKLSLRDVRKVGWAMYANKDPLVPCHRVVKASGSLCINHPEWLAEQRFRLLQEGVTFASKDMVAMDKHLWNGKETTV